MSSLDSATMRILLNAVADTIIGHKDSLNEVDSEIGDADHGTGMAQSFTKAKDKLAAADADIAGQLKAFGTGIMGGGGGASGALFSGIFMDGAKTLAGKESVEPIDFAAWWRAGLEKVQARGKAQVGDKTMVDALDPAVRALENYAGEGFVNQLTKAAAAAWSGVEATKNLVAGQGRSRYAGERSLGHQDAGATSVAYIFDAMRDVLKDAGL